jgi:hypothetical protein
MGLIRSMLGHHRRHHKVWHDTCPFAHLPEVRSPYAQRRSDGSLA